MSEQVGMETGEPLGGPSNLTLLSISARARRESILYWILDCYC